MWMHCYLGVGTGATSLLDQAKEGKMRRVTLILAAMAVMVSLFAAAAYAAQIEGTVRGETLRESDQNDWITARAGDDFVYADFDGDDTDRVRGNRNNDTIYVDDGDDLDHAIGGRGNEDVCFGDPGDDLDCDINIQ
jgi:Ca2+-binding RTX toxin-like protein